MQFEKRIISRPTLSVIMPAYNEEELISASVEKTLVALKYLDAAWEFIVVNDCSSDATGKIIDDIASEKKGFRVVHNAENRGIGGAFLAGVAEAKLDVVLLVPVDNPLTQSEFESFLQPITICDIVVGQRAERVGYPPHALMASFIYNRLLIPLLFNVGIQDANWIQAYRRDVFTKHLPEIRFQSIFFLVEVLVRAKRERLIITEIQSQMARRLVGKATVYNIKSMIKAFRDMILFFIEIQFKNKQRLP